MRRAAIYCRVSTWEQAKNGYSLQYQMETLPEIARTQGFIVEQEDIYFEIISGAIDDRPEYNRMLTQIIAGNYHAVFVAEKSRLSRTENREEEERIVKIMQKCGCLVITPDTIYDPNAIDGELFWDIQSAVDRNERKRIKDRNARGRYMKASKGGYYGGRVPHGYVPYWDKNTGKVHCEIDEIKMQPVRLSYQWLLEGMLVYQIAKKLDEMGYKTKNNQPLDDYRIRYWLRNPHYAGYTHIGRAPYPKTNNRYLFEENQYLKPIISKADFAKVQQILEVHSENWKKNRLSPDTHPLLGIICCPNCQTKMSRHVKLSNTKVKYRWYYRCFRQKNKQRCKGKFPSNIPTNVIHKLTIEILLQLSDYGYEIIQSELLEHYQHLSNKRPSEPLTIERISKLKILFKKYLKKIEFHHIILSWRKYQYRITKFITVKNEIFILDHQKIQKLLSL